MNPANQKVINALEFVLEHAQMPRERCGVPREHQEAMRLYLDIWVALPVKQALEFLKGERASWQIDNWN